MQKSKIDYYNSLLEEDKKILQISALKAKFSIDYQIQILVQTFLGKNRSQKYIETVLRSAIEQELFTKTENRMAECIVSTDFLVFILPQMNIKSEIWEQINKRYSFFYYEVTNSELFRNCLYALLYQPEKYKEVEQIFLSSSTRTVAQHYVDVLIDEQYNDYLNKISKEIVSIATFFVISDAINELVSLSETEKLIEKIGQLSNTPDLKQISNFEMNKNFWLGNIDKVLEVKNDIADFNAIKSLTTGNIEESLKFFNQVIKKQNNEGNKSPLPERFYITYFYIIALLLSEPSIAMTAFKKVMQWEMRNKYGFYRQFMAIIFDGLNEGKNALQSIKIEVKYNIINPKIDVFSICDMLIYHLVNEKIEQQYATNVYNVLKKSVDAGYYLLCYEAAFVAKTWFDEQRFEDLYSDLSAKFNYPPAISRINRQEDWEKSLNLLLGMKSKSTTKNDENAARVVYYFNPNNESIQPVLQTRQAKGWSSGRNIALKTFYSTEVKGMTSQDIRISKCIKYYQDYYYGCEYSFDKKVFFELIGHPYIFLENSKDIPVEFIATTVIVSVKKVQKGYQLVTDLKVVDKDFFIEKETNTRYKIYNLTANQMYITKIINEKTMFIPETGKKKLTELLGTLSAEGFSVHSDLVASDENVSITIKEVPADSRIRVQLLPLGDGLKTELFSKPFGEKPPYCKPGRGGKVLIANEKNIQLQVKRNLKQESENEQILLNEIQSLESLNDHDGLMSFDDQMDSLFLLDILAKYPDISVVEWPEGEKYKLRGKVNIDNLNISITSEIDWFDLQGELRVDENTVLTLQQLMKLTEKSRTRFIELSPGEFIALSDRLKKQLDNLRLFSNNDKKGLHINKFASVGLEDFFDEIENLKVDKAWKTFRQQVEKAKVENAIVPSSLNAELRTYQEDGFRWMARLAQWNGGACLADDMGLGKTVQALAILLHRASMGAALVIAPVSVVNNWVSEAEKFAPTLKFKTLGTSTSNRKEVLQSLKAGDVLVTSYGLLLSEEKLFSELEFASVVLDEAHVIKNYATKTSKATMQLKAGFRMALTGTPLQNHLGEIWNLFNFINPGLLGSLQYFSDTFVKSGDEQSKKHLKKMISPFILRRTKTAVLEELPPKTEIVKKIQLSDEEAAFYEALRRQALENLSNVDESKHLQVLAEITKLRQASCNPLLIDPNINIASSKLNTFLDIVDELIESKHRALVFSQFVTHLSIVRKALDKKGIKYQYIDGSTSQAERERSVKRFQDGESELFLISLKAGGLGLNLTAADYVIHLDPWWNPAVEDQASDRAHRIGQQRPVTIYRLVAENTIEEKIIQLHHHKRDLAEQLLEGSDMAARLSVRDMVELIRNGVNV